jgi:hypothetical protein
VEVNVSVKARQARVFSLLRLLLTTDEPNTELYELCAAHGACLMTDDEELALVASLLTAQGFLRGADEADLYEHWLHRVAESREGVLAQVNNSLSANHIVR